MKNYLINFIQDKIAPKIQKVYEYFYFKKLRNKLKNKDFSLFSPNCYAGVIYHRLGLQFQSPTINLFFPSKKQYLKFLTNIKYYLSKELVFIKNSWNCPTAMLEDIEIVFNHSKTEDEASEQWNKRKQRVNYDNIFLIFDDIGDATYSDLIEFLKIPCKGKMILTAKNYPEFKNKSVQITKYKKSRELRPYMSEKNIWTGKNPADRDFDFISWLNNGN